MGGGSSDLMVQKKWVAMPEALLAVPTTAQLQDGNKCLKRCRTLHYGIKDYCKRTLAF
jgi:hypothetical protein